MIVFDPGGPGADLRSSASILTSFGASEETVVVAFIEPWTMSPISQGCKHAADGYLAEMRSSRPYVLPESTFDLSVDCSTEVSNARAFVEERLDVLRYLVDQAPDSQVKYLGWSFATHRLAKLSESFPLDSAPIISPIQHGQHWHQLLSDRVDRSRMIMENANMELGKASAGHVSIDGRSTDITPFDIAAAKYAALYDIGTNHRWLSTAIDAYNENNIDSDELAQLGSAADSIMGRYGVNSLYPGIVGYWTEFCYLTVDSREIAVRPTDDIAWFLYAFHQPCKTIVSESGEPVDYVDVYSVCLVVGGLDPLAAAVTPSGWAEMPHVLDIPDAGHLLSLDRPDIANLVEQFTTTEANRCELS